MTQNYANSSKAYTRASHTVGKTRQVVMLYDGIIRFLNQAAEAIEQKRIEERYHKLTRAANVITGLQACLDFDIGGKTAQALYDFYSSVDTRIFTLHRKPDSALCRQLVQELKEMRDVWDGIDRGAEAQAPKAPPAEPAASPEAAAAGTVKVSA